MAPATHVKIPTSEQEATAMLLLATNYLKGFNPRPIGSPGPETVKDQQAGEPSNELVTLTKEQFQAARALIMHSVRLQMRYCGNSYANAGLEHWLTLANRLGCYAGPVIGNINNDLLDKLDEATDQAGGLPDLPDPHTVGWISQYASVGKIEVDVPGRIHVSEDNGFALTHPTLILGRRIPAGSYYTAEGLEKVLARHRAEGYNAGIEQAHAAVTEVRATLGLHGPLVSSALGAAQDRVFALKKN